MQMTIEDKHLRGFIALTEIRIGDVLKVEGLDLPLTVVQREMTDVLSTHIAKALGGDASLAPGSHDSGMFIKASEMTGKWPGNRRVLNISLSGKQGNWFITQCRSDFIAW